jgi:hypothetical protein
MARSIRDVHTETAIVIAEGSVGWGITPFAGNQSISNRDLRASFEPTFIPSRAPDKPDIPL